MKTITAITIQNANDALEFYKGIFNAEISNVIMKSNIPGFEDPQYQGLIAHSEITFGETTLFIKDYLDNKENKSNEDFMLCLYVDSEEELNTSFNKLKINGTVDYEIRDESWGAKTGSLIDKFGIKWELMLIL